MKDWKLRPPWQAVLAIFLFSGTLALLFAVFVGPSGAFVQITVFTAIALVSAAVLGVPALQIVQELLRGRRESAHNPGEPDGDSHKDEKRQGLNQSFKHFNLQPGLTEREIQAVLLAQVVFNKQEIDLERARRLSRLYDILDKVVERKDEDE